MADNFRQARREDLPALVDLLATDKLGATREQRATEDLSKYVKAFAIIDADPHQELIVLERDGQIIGTLQLSFIQYLTYTGGLRAQVEAVRVHQDYRGQGLGKQMLEYAIERAKAANAHLVQLTTDKRRPEAIRFYTALGFTPSHEGMKLHL